MLKYCDKDGIEKTIIDNENISDYVSGSGVSDEWKSSIEETVTVHSKNIDSLNATVGLHSKNIDRLNVTVGSHSNSIDSLNNSINDLNARQNISIGLNGSTLYINW